MRKRTIIVLTVINVTVFILALLCFIGTGINNKIFNSIESFTYRETEKGVVFVTESGKEIPMQFDEQSVRVLKTKQKIGREERVEIVRFIREYATRKGYSLRRTNTELYGEYRLHLILYRLGYKRKQTGDADLDYDKDKRWYVERISKIIGWVGV